MEHETFLEDIAAYGGKELLDAVEAEFRLGWQREAVLTELEMQNRAAVSSTRTSGGVDGLGRITMDVPATSYHFWLQWGRKRGVRNIWKDSQFRRDYARDNGGAVVKYQRQNPFQGWTPAREHGLIQPASKYTRVKEAAAA